MDSEMMCPVTSLIQQLCMEEYGGNGLQKQLSFLVFSLNSMPQLHSGY